MGALHFLDVGCADASVIITDTATFLIDCQDIGKYRRLLPASMTIKALFLTHQHSDHYSGLEYLRDNGYKIEYLIYSPYERRRGDTSITLDEWNEFNNHREYFEGKGTKSYKPYKQESFDKPWWEPAGLKFWMLGPKKSTATSEARKLHDACLVFRADMGTRKCLFTGDASDANLEGVAEINHICDDILHASHHGSIEGANPAFVKKCNAKWTIISTASGTYPNVPHPTAIQRYKENSSEGIWRTDVDGSGQVAF
jgi:beta-lactamase superfamily II metal-dependent hydrolase